MNSTLSTTASVLHDLGLATSVGGSLFGKTGLHPAARGLREEDARGQVTSAAWKHFTPLNLASHVAVVATWLVARSVLSGRAVDRTTRHVVHTKDALVGIYLGSGLASTAAGYAFDGARDKRGFLRASRILGTINLMAGAGLIGITAVLAMGTGRSLKAALLSRVLR